MNNGYKPPQMPPFPETPDAMYSALALYHHDQRPLDLFFEFLVVDIIGLLPQSTDAAIRQLVAKYPAFFESTRGNWRRGLRAELHLSDTIDIAVLDLWYCNSASATASGWSYHPWHFAKNFIDNYFADNSQVDVWEGDSLQQAKNRIQVARGGS